MKPIFIKISIYLNIILLLTVILYTYKVGGFDVIVTTVKNWGYKVLNKKHRDYLIANTEWQDTVKNQVKLTQGQAYNSCIFGDSITARLGNTIEPDTFNFALNSMSTVSLVEQLKILTAANLRCSQVIIAIGANDALYDITDDLFIKNLQKVITLSHKTTAKQIVLIPAFYATLAASHDSNMAGTNERIDEINTLIAKVGEQEQVVVATKSTQLLFKNHALKQSLTIDGVHLNQDGLIVYGLALLEIIHPGCYHPKQ